MFSLGNIQVSSAHLGTPRDVVVPSDDSSTYVKSMVAFKAWSEAAHASGTSSPPPVIVQLCHTGRQSTRGSGRSPFTPSKSASAVPLNAGGNGIISKAVSRLMFGTPKEMSLRDIDIVVESFVQGARVSKEAGFEGVQLHCSHGYLLAQFLSPNVRLFFSCSTKRSALTLSRIE
jgi:2,4-dienoyl-CoA reductase-like NADH-dependent reductase (Old Yellow Enzyme family)